jgi:hypothetical protein
MLTPSQGASSGWKTVHLINAVPSPSATPRLTEGRPLTAGSGSPYATGEPIAEHRQTPTYTELYDGIGVEAPLRRYFRTCP